MLEHRQPSETFNEPSDALSQPQLQQITGDA